MELNMTLWPRKRPTRRLVRPPEFPDNLPGSAYDLILWLDRLYAPRFPRPAEPAETWQREAGARELIDMLMERMQLEITPEIVEPSDASDPRTLTQPRTARAL